MTNDEYHAGMFTLNHKPDCNWHADQYWWECDCGAVKPEIHEEYKRRRFGPYGIKINGQPVIAATGTRGNN